MKQGLHNLKSVVTRRKRIGRGVAGGGAKSGRGMKGQKSRAGYSRRAGFEGGQTPLYQRLPKSRGSKQFFTSQVRKPVAVTVARLNSFEEGSIVGLGVLREAGILSDKKDKVKLIGGGELNHKLTVRVSAITESAEAAVKKAGGKVELIES